MSKSNQGNQIKSTICFFLKIVLICTPALFFTSLSAKKIKNAAITYRPDTSIDYTDSPGITDHSLPDSSKKLAQLIKQNFRTRDQVNIVKTSGKITGKKKYYLDLKTIEDVNAVFFSLRRIYGEGAQCDTTTILLTYQIKQKRLYIEKLYNFLKTRSSLIKNEKKYEWGSYHTLLGNFFSFMTIKSIPTDQLVGLPESLPETNNSIIVLFMEGRPGHMTVVQHMREGHYIYSCGYTDGSVYYLSSKNGRPEWDQSNIITAQYGIIQ